MDEHVHDWSHPRDAKPCKCGGLSNYCACGLSSHWYYSQGVGRQIKHSKEMRNENELQPNAN